MWILAVLVLFPIYYWILVGNKKDLPKVNFWVETSFLTAVVFLMCAGSYRYGINEEKKQETKVFFIRNNKVEQVKDTLFVLEKDTINNKEFRKQTLFTAQELGR